MPLHRLTINHLFVTTYIILLILIALYRTPLLIKYGHFLDQSLGLFAPDPLLIATFMYTCPACLPGRPHIPSSVFLILYIPIFIHLGLLIFHEQLFFFFCVYSRFFGIMGSVRPLSSTLMASLGGWHFPRVDGCLVFVCFLSFQLFGSSLMVVPRFCSFRFELLALLGKGLFCGG